MLVYKILDMKNLLLLLLLFLAVSCKNSSMVGVWIEKLPEGTPYIQGIHLKENGEAEALGTKTLLYHRWKVTDKQLILSGESVGNGQTIQLSDTMDVLKLKNDTLVVRRKGNEVVYLRKGNEQKMESVNNVPSREAYEGFVWNKLSGAGLNLWVQRNDDIRLIADSSLPGIVMVRNGDPAPYRLIQIFDLPNRNIDDVIKILEKSDNWDKQQTCKFEEVKSSRKGVKRFVLVPAGDYAVKVEMQMKSEPVPAPCNGWGVGNSGKRFFEIHESHPDKAVFMEIGQEAPLFDENSVVFSDSQAVQHGSEAGKSTDELYVLSGTVCIGHEVRSFKPEDSDEEFWLVDKTGKLNEIYDKKTNGMKNGKPLYVTLKVEYNGKWDDGFAADYSGVYFVREILECK